MAISVSGSGLQVHWIFSKTFPIGFTTNQFATDTDSLAATDQDIMAATKTLNGELVYYSVNNPLEIAVSFPAGSKDDINMQIAAKANTTGVGKVAAEDEINAIGIFPNGTGFRLINGVIIKAPAIPSVAGQGNKKTNTYTFNFEAASSF